MKNTYSIKWSSNALIELNSTYSYLKQNFTPKEIKKLSRKIESTLQLISRNLLIFPSSQKYPAIRRAVIMKYNTLYYKVNIETIEIISFYANRKDQSTLDS